MSSKRKKINGMVIVIRDPIIWSSKGKGKAKERIILKMKETKHQLKKKKERKFTRYDPPISNISVQNILLDPQN